MDFDFSNYTYSGLITIFSMIMGMAYPAVQNAICEIDTKYDSGQIVDCFMTEVSYKWFRFCLALSVFSALCCPFVLVCCKNAVVHYTWVFVHALIVLSLIASAIKLYSTIMIYYRSGELVEYIKTRAEKEKKKVASLLADIANYAAWKGQKKVYMAAEQAIAEQLAAELRSQKYDIKPAKYDVGNPSTMNSSLSEDMNRAIERIVSIQKNRRYDSFFTADATIISLLYNILEQHSISHGMRDLIWRMVSEIALSNNKEWIITYWEIADQYMRSLKFSRTPKNEKEAKQMQEGIMMMKEFHAAIGGMLIKYGKIHWLRDILFFTSTQPASYPLLSNTFADVVEMVGRFEKKLQYPFLWTIQKHYSMKGIVNDVNGDADIVRYVDMFIAIEFLRLWHIEYNGEYTNPLQPLQVMEKVEQNQDYLEWIEGLQRCVDVVFDKKLNSKLNFSKPSKKDAERYIDENKRKFNEHLKFIENNPEVDEDKCKGIINSIKEAARSWKESSVDIKNERFTEVQQLFRVMPYRFPKEYILKHYKSPGGSLGDGIVGALQFYFDSVLPQFFMTQEAVAGYKIAYKYVGDALRKIMLDNNYVILSFGFDYNNYFEINNKLYPEASFKDGVWEFNGAVIHEQLSIGESMLIILKKNDVPMADLVENEAENSAVLISADMPIYSNISKVDGNTYMNVFFKMFIDVYYPADMKFIKITIPNVLTENKYDLDKVQSVDGLFGSSFKC